jgi:mRNA-degrading endonuclease RelE of RelBE toxin-antitoxin system
MEVGVGEPFEIKYAPEAVADIKSLRAFDQSKVLDGIERHLSLEPKKTSRSRIKEMMQPFWSRFRLRVESVRVYYDVNDDEHVSTCYASCIKRVKRRRLTNEKDNLERRPSVGRHSAVR